MKKIISAELMIGAILLLTNSRASYAQTPGHPTTDRSVQLSDDLHLSLGFRVWVNDWSTFGGVDNPPFPMAIFSTDDWKPGYIPTVGLRYKDFLVSASGMFTPRYHFHAG